MIDDKPAPGHPAEAEAPQALRQRADAMTRGRPLPTPAQLAAMEPAEVLHELQLHQIELERQNEELRQAHQEIEASRSRYYDLYHLAPVGYCTISAQGLILTANRTASALLGRPQSALVQKPIKRFILQQDQDTYDLQRKQLLETGEAQACELQMVKHDGTSFWGHLQSTVQQNAVDDPEILCVLHNISERKAAEESLTMEQSLLRTLVDLLPAMVFIKDRDSRFLVANTACAHYMGVASPEELLGKTDADFYPSESAANFRRDELNVLEGHPLRNSEQRREFPDGSWKVLLTTKVPKRDSEGKIIGVVGTSFDITERVKDQQLLAWEKSALELIVSSESLNKVLDRLMLGLEDHATGSICSVLLLDDDGLHLRHGAAPSLPEAYNQAIDGVAIGPAVGSCGTAAFESRQVIVTDIEGDPLWADYRELALKHGLRACWSTPIHCTQGRVLGTFAIYYREPRHPTASEMELIERALHVVRLAIERAKASEKLRKFRSELEERVAQRTADLQSVNASLNDFKAALDEHALVSVTDAAGIITYANDKFCAVSKFLREDLVGQDHRIVNSGHHPKAFFRDLWDTITSGQVWKDDLQNQAKDGSFYWVNTTIVPFLGPDGQPIQFMAILTDITERKDAEERIATLHADLERHAADLQTTNKELEAFSYSVSHDLRAPLRAIDGFSRMVLEDYAGQLDDEGQRMLGVIQSEAQRMGRLIDDLLAFSRLGRQAIEPSRIDVGAMAREVFDELAARNPERNVRLALHALPPAQGTESLIRQVWVNLISNALKFTRTRETGEIEIGVQKGEEDELIFYIKDNGAGFDMRYAEKLFGVFQRLHSQQDFTGTGVGLALVQRIVQRHGGRVWAESEVDHGATFFFTLKK